jgi:hypothetical protein
MMNLKKELLKCEGAGLGWDLDDKLTRKKKILSEWAHKNYHMSYHTTLIFLYKGLFDGKKRLKSNEICELIKQNTGIITNNKGVTYTMYRALKIYGIPKNIIQACVKRKPMSVGELPDNEPINCQTCGEGFFPSPTNWTDCKSCFGVHQPEKKKRCLRCDKNFTPTETRRNLCYQCFCLNRTESE